MAIIPNGLTYGYGFNITAAGPIDSRMRVLTLTDLTSVWDDENAKLYAPSYAGMVVSVNETNDLYMLKTEGFDDKGNPIKADPKNIESWQKIGLDSNIETTISNVENMVSDLSINLLSTQEQVSSVENNITNITTQIGNEGTEDVPATGLYQYINTTIENTEIDAVTTNEIIMPKTSSNPMVSQILKHFSTNTNEDGLPVLPTGITFQEFVEYLLSDEQFPNISPSNPSITLSFSAPTLKAKCNGVSFSGGLVEIGTSIVFEGVTCSDVKVTSSKNGTLSGFKYSYATSLDKSSIVTPTQTTISSPVKYNQISGSQYSIEAKTNNNWKSGTLPTKQSSSTPPTLNGCTLVANFGLNTYSASTSGCSYEFSCDKINKVYIVSSIKTLKDKYTAEMSAYKDTKTVNPQEANMTVTGVWPIYHNADWNNNTFNDSANIRFALTSGNEITFEKIPSMEEVGKPFIMEFPKSKSLLTGDNGCKILVTGNDWNSANNLSNYSLTEIKRTVNGIEYDYVRFQLKSMNFQNISIKFRFNERLDKE